MKLTKILRSLPLGLLLSTGLMTQSTGTILVRTDEAAHVWIDGQVSKSLPPYMPAQFRVSPGRHWILARSATGDQIYEETIKIEAGERAVVLADLARRRVAGVRDDAGLRGRRVPQEERRSEEPRDQSGKRPARSRRE